MLSITSEALVIEHFANWKPWPISFDAFTYETWLFSIALLNDQRDRMS